MWTLVASQLARLGAAYVDCLRSADEADLALVFSVAGGRWALLHGLQRAHHGTGPLPRDPIPMSGFGHIVLYCRSNWARVELFLDM